MILVCGRRLKVYTWVDTKQNLEDFLLFSEEKWSDFFFDLYFTNKLSKIVKEGKLKICSTCRSYFKQRAGATESFSDLYNLEGGVYIRPLSYFMIRNTGIFSFLGTNLMVY